MTGIVLLLEVFTTHDHETGRFRLETDTASSLWLQRLEAVQREADA